MGSGPSATGVSSANINTAQQGVNNTISQQQAFLNALQGQNGLQNQSNIYNQLQGIASGTGPNPALAQLNQTTGQNVAQQAALAAGQRGASQNVGLIQRQNAQTGANVQQQAAGQAASLQAQQQLNAINSAGNIANTQASQVQSGVNAQTQAALQAQQQQLGLQESANAAGAGAQTAGVTGNQAIAGGLINAGGGVGSAALGPSSTPAAGASGGMVPQYAFGDAVGAPVGNLQAAPTPMSQTPEGFQQAAQTQDKRNASSTGAVIGDVGRVAGMIVGALAAAKGGMVPSKDSVKKMADGGGVTSDKVNATTPGEAQSFIGKALQNTAQSASQAPAGASSLQSSIGQLGPIAYKAGKAIYNGLSNAGSGAAPNVAQGVGATNNALTAAQDSSAALDAGADASDAYEAGQTALDSGLGAADAASGIGSTIATVGEDAGESLLAKGGMTHDYRSGGKVQAALQRQKATKPGNDYANDKIPAVLSEHEIVLPRTVTMSKNAPAAAAKFVQAVLAKKGLK